MIDVLADFTRIHFRLEELRMISIQVFARLEKFLADQPSVSKHEPELLFYADKVPFWTDQFHKIRVVLSSPLSVPRVLQTTWSSVLRLAQEVDSLLRGLAAHLSELQRLHPCRPRPASRAPSPAV